MVKMPIPPAMPSPVEKTFVCRLDRRTNKITFNDIIIGTVWYRDNSGSPDFAEVVLYANKTLRVLQSSLRTLTDDDIIKEMNKPADVIPVPSNFEETTLAAEIIDKLLAVADVQKLDPAHLRAVVEYLKMRRIRGL